MISPFSRKIDYLKFWSLDLWISVTKDTYFPSALFPKLWNSIELELKETKSAKLFKRKIFKNQLDSYASYICKKITVFHVDKLSLAIFFTL